MPEKIGKYHVVERIGRGGMGMIFKAHDPVLDRLVAIKVISPEVEVTDELRARFFREAQACAKLNHPNIVTVFDMGEDEGRLFIVMELLEGDELRRLIAQRTALPLEDKLSVMLQVCSGLHYAHQKGIVHRDMKPGNVFLLRNGQVKIVDFGIAHIGSTQTGLTRTGLIMGTLRYISPEQVRGRADHRSDMFSIGSVFYELLTARPPFLGEDPMQLLEQLRTEDPPPPTQIDPTIPSPLSDIVQRAMRKNPADRFSDLEEMRAQLEVVYGGLLEERQRVVASVRRQGERIVQLRAALAERVGPSEDEEPVRAITERNGLVAARAAEHEYAAVIEALEARIVQADALAPAVQRAWELLDAGRFEDAVAQFETILADAPAHRRAREGLARARAEAEARQRLESSRQEARRLARQQTDEAHAQMAKARADAQTEGAAQLAPSLWNDAEASAAAAQADLRREGYADAKQGFDQAAAAYRRAQDAARQVQLEERRAAERAREMATQGQRQAQAVGASQYARELWDAAEARFAEAQAVFAKTPSARAGSAFTEAAALYRRAEEAARDAREREHRRADAARERAAEGRRSAATMDAEHRVPAIWQEAVGKSSEGEAALLRNQYGKAAEAFEAALALYHQTQAQVRQLTRQQHEEAGKKQGDMAERRRAAMAAEAASHAASDWNEAEASAGAGDGALAREAWEDAVRAFDQAATLYRRAEERSREALRARAEAEKAVEAVERARRAAAGAQAARHAPEPWKEAERAEARAVAALSQQQFAAALPLFDEASRLYAAAQAAGVAAEAEVRPKAGQPPVEPPVKPVDKTRRQAEDAGRRPGFDDAPTVLIRPTEMVKPSPAIADRKAVSVPASAPAPIGAIRLPPEKSSPPFWRLWTRAAVVGVGILAGLTLGIFWWRSEPPPVSPPAVTQPLPAPPAATPPVAPSSEPPAGRDEAQKLQSQVPIARDESSKADAEPSTPTPAKRPSVQNPDRVVATTPPPARPDPGPAGSGRPSSVKPRPPEQPSAPQQSEPSRIRESVVQKLRGAKLLRTPNSDEPGVAVEEVGADGSVTLVGVLRDSAARQAAVDLVRTVPGVTAVDVRRVTVQKGWVSQ